jgi:hypothetical protein
MFITDVLTTEAIAAYVTEAASNRIPFLGEAYFPNRKKMGIDLQWLKSHKGINVALKPSNFDAIPAIRPRGQAQMTKEQMPLFRESMIIKETDLAELARIQDSNDPYLRPIVDSMFDDAGTLVEGAEISAEIERMSLLAPKNGDMKISIGLSDNTAYEYDYDSDGSWKSNNYEELASTSTWDNPSTAKPLDDIRTGINYLANIGVAATTIIGNSTTLNYLVENDQVKSAIVTMTGSTVNFVDEATVEEVLSRRLRVQFIAYDKTYKDYNGNTQKFYPDDYITILGDGALGNTWRGSTPEELTTIGNFMDIPQAPVDITVLESGIAIAVMAEYKPSFTVTTTASQIALPSFEGMDGIYVIKVK